MIDFERIEGKTTFFVDSIRLAEELIKNFGLKWLVDVRPSKKVEGRKVYVFYNKPELFKYFREYVEARKQSKQAQVVKEVKEPVSVPVPVPLVVEEDAEKYPKRRSRKKKSEE